jgi:hypothetical protein
MPPENRAQNIPEPEAPGRVGDERITKRQETDDDGQQGRAV